MLLLFLELMYLRKGGHMGIGMGAPAYLFDWVGEYIFIQSGPLTWAQLPTLKTFGEAEHI